MRSDLRLMSPVRAMLLVILLFVVAGCAPSSNIVIDAESITNQSRFDSYRHFVVRQFTLPAEFQSGGATDKISGRELRYTELPQKLSTSIERSMKGRRLFQQVSRSDADYKGGGVMILSGSFIRVGRFKITVEGRLNDAATGSELAYFQHTLWDVFDTTDSIDDLGKEIVTFIDRIHYR
jgi:hypothetical protein